jgi:hypothetical protein
MATLPDAFDLGQRPNLRAPKKIVSDQSGEILGDALAQFGSNVSQIAGRELQRQDKLNFAQARSAYLQADIAARDVAGKDNDWENSPKSYENAMGKAREQALGMVRNNEDRALLQQDLVDDSAQGLQAVRGIANRKRVDVQNASLDSLIDTNSNAALTADPVVADKLHNQIYDAIDGAVAMGNVSAEHGGALKRKVAESQAEKMIQLKTPDEQLAALADPSKGPAQFVPADRRQILLESAQREKAAQVKALQAAQVNDKVTAIMGAYAKDGQRAGTRALSDLSGLPAELQDEVRSKVNTQINQRRDVAQQQNADTLAGIKRSIATNTADGNTEAAIHRLYNDGAFTPEQYADQLASYDRSKVEGAKEVASSAIVRQALVSGMPLDPQDPVVKKSLIAAFNQDTATMQPGSQDWLNTASIYAARTRVLPAQASSWARKSLLSPDPAVAAPAAQFVASIRATSPDASQEFDEKTRAFSDLTSDMIAAGTKPDKAVEQARRLVYETNENLDRQRQQEYDNKTKGGMSTTTSALNNFIDRDFDTSLFSAQPSATPGLQADFDAQARKYYRLNGGNLDAARDSAWKDLKGVYGVSEVNGTKQMMALPPERFGVKPDAIRKDVADFITANPQPDGLTADDIVIVPDALTQRTASTLLNGNGSAQPSYQLMTKNGDVVTDAKGNRKRYFLPSNEDWVKNIREATAAAEAEAQRQVEETKRKRQIRDDTQSLPIPLY